MNTSLIKLAVALIAPAMIVGSTASGQGEKPLPPADQALQPLTMEVVPTTIVASAFTYQGQLRQNNLPVNGTCSAAFKLFDAETAGNQIGPTVDIPSLQVQNGLFTVALDFGWGVFNGEGRWLETAVGCNQRLVTLAPRTALRATPYALALPGMRTVPAQPDAFGNPTMNVIGGLVNGPLSNTISSNTQNSIIAGGASNRIDEQSHYSVIAGGAQNQILDRGMNSNVMGGFSNVIDHYSISSVIGGGTANRIDRDSDGSVVAGGGRNIIDQDSDGVTIAGGLENLVQASSDYASIAGGEGNMITASASFASIPGGLLAKATLYGQQAFASGGFYATPGTAQSSLYVLRNQTSDAQATKLYLDETTTELALPVGRAMLFDIQVMAEADATTRYDMGAYHFIGAVNNYGNTQLRGTKTVLWEDAYAVGWDANITTNDGHSVSIVVSGGANQNVRWVATVRTTEVEWPASTAMNAQDAPVPEKK